MLVREIISENKERIDEIAFMALVPYIVPVVTALGAIWTAVDIYYAIQEYVDGGGSLTDFEELKNKVGPEAAIAIRDFVIFYGVTRVAAMTFNTFRRLWAAARKRTSDADIGGNAAAGAAAIAGAQAIDATGATEYP